ncbi:MAG: histidine--tRNA ligase [Candidatus Micrarchaeia archaeon]
MAGRARGMRDIMPGDEIIYKRILGIIEKNYKAYGFDPVSHPAIELLSVLEAKSGEGIKTEIFRIDDGELGLRFDLTVSLARMLSENLGLPLPFKRYCIEKVWRREEPQYGRYREFIQADADIVGSSGVECEAELITCACRTLDELGIDKYEVLINSRKLVAGVLERIGIKGERAEVAMRIIDKLDKKEREDILKELRDNGFENAEEIIEEFSHDLSYYEDIDSCKEATGEISRLLNLLSMYNIDRNKYKFDPSVIRGLGYYTGIVYEIKGIDKRLGTLVAGGRYDNLIGIYAGRDVPAVGISFGIDRIAQIIKGDNKSTTCTDIVLVNVTEKNYNTCVKYAEELRKKGVNVRVDLMGRNMRKQLDYASSIGVMFVGIIGDKEEKDGSITLKNLQTGEQKTIPVKDVPAYITKSKSC